MSDEPIIDDLPTEDTVQESEPWVLPEPVFQTTPGYTPKGISGAAPADDDEPTEIPDEVAIATTEEMPAYKPKAKGGCFRSFLFIFATIALLGAAIVAALIYFLFYSGPADNATF